MLRAGTTSETKIKTKLSKLTFKFIETKGKESLQMRSPNEESPGDSNSEFLSVNETCATFNFSRSTFYRMYEDPGLELKKFILRIPPVSGRLRIPKSEFIDWLKRRSSP